jgi:TolB-like protein/DNA-binding winged helix-turn-helix (wHTH) protein/Flp pilus assembly protein TadD
MPPGDGLAHYRIADLAIDVGRRSVRRGDSDIHLSRLSFDVLRTLLDAAPNVVSNDELTRTVWKGVVVGPESVTQRIKLLRDALGDDPDAPRYIVGLRGQGYRILPPVAVESEIVKATASEPSDSFKGGTTRLRLVGIVLAATTLAVAVAYFAVDQLLIPKHGEVSETTSHAKAASGPAAVPAMTPFAPPPHSIAVLPFLNMSGDAKQDYFSDGLTEELLNDLSRIKELQVASRTSSFSFKGKDADIGTIARKLNVGAVLEGSVRRAAGKIRVTAQLNDAVTGFHLWSQTYDRDLGDVLKLQSEIATTVARALKVTLLNDDASKIEVGGTRNAAAFDAYLRASNAYWNRRDDKDRQTAISEYTEAIRLDPGYAMAYAARSIAEFAAAAAAAVPGDLLDRARTDAHRAIALAPAMGEGHIALAGVYVMQLQFAAASEEYERALALAPGNARVLRNYGAFAGRMGRGEFGLALIRRAVALDPLNPALYDYLGSALSILRRDAEALAAYRHCEVLKPAYCSLPMGLLYYALGDFESARSSCEKKVRDDARYCLAVVYDKLGRHSDAENVLAKLRANGDSAAYQCAEIYAQWGNTSESLRWLEAAFRIRYHDLDHLKTDGLMDPLRQEPRFQAIERELKFPN